MFISVRLKLGSPAVFRQRRIGKDEKPFEILKFRSMLPYQSTNGELLTFEEHCARAAINPSSVLSDEQRLTYFGRLLRSSSLDELPELFNILRGDMSLVGPRPLVAPYLPYYSDRERHRHDVLPGLTGLAQVRGRNSVSWKERFELDVEYTENVSFLLDLRIIFETITVVFKRDGIGQGEEKPVDFNVERQAEWDREQIENQKYA